VSENLGREPKRQRIVRVSRELLQEALHLPPGAIIKDISLQLFFDTDDVAIKIEHPDFTPVYPPSAIPTVRPMLGVTQNVKFMGWQE
jgi:hypothetical protein